MTAPKHALSGKKDLYHGLLVEGYRRLGSLGLAGATDTTEANRHLDDNSRPPAGRLGELVGVFLAARARGERPSIRSFCSDNKLPQKQFEQALRQTSASGAVAGSGDDLAKLPDALHMAYYQRTDVQEALLTWSEGRRVAMHFRQGPVRLGIRKGSDIPALAAVSDSGVPTFHASVGRYDRMRLVAFDLVAEVDHKGDWQACFRAVRPLVHGLREAGCTFMVKFSGHSSAHVLVPCRGLSYGDAAQTFLRRIPASLRSGAKLDLSFRDPRHFLRAPYALHERTGLVSVPLTVGQFDTFSPAMAEPGSVVVDIAALRRYMAADNTAWLNHAAT